MKKIKIDKELVLKHLYNGIVNLTFKKANGELREMNATLITRYIDAKEIKESMANPPESDPNLVICWDIDKKGWRSFKIDTIEEYKGVTGR